MRRRAFPVSLVLFVNVCLGSVLTVSATGCSGPERVRNVVTKEVPVDVHLSRGASGGVVAEPGTNLGPLTFPGFVGPPLSRTEFDDFSRLLPVIPCDPDLTEPPKLEAPTKAYEPPQFGTYQFKTEGTFKIEGPKPREGDHPPTTQRAVRNIIIDVDEAKANNERYSVWRFDVVATVGKTTTTTTYRGISSAPEECIPRLAPPDIFATVFLCDNFSTAGIYIDRVETKEADGSTSLFEPLDPGVKIAEFPLEVGRKWHSSGVDGSRSIEMSLDQEVVAKQRVFACNVPMDTWVIKVSNGSIQSNTQDLAFEGLLYVGSQYGGLLVADDITIKGRDGDSIVTTRSSNVALTEPLPAKFDRSIG